MLRTAAATSCTPATSDVRRAGACPRLAGVAGLALAAGLVVFGAAHAQTAPRPAGADQGRVLLDTLNQVDALGRQVRELRGQLEETTSKVDQANDRAQRAEKRQSDLYNDTDGRLRRIEQLLKEDAAERKKVSAQMAELDLRMKKVEADLDVQVKKLEAELEGKVRRVESAGTAGGAAAAQIAELEARLKRLEQGGGGSPSADLEARIRRLEQLAINTPSPAAAAAVAGEALPGSAATPVTPPPTTSASKPAPGTASQLPPASLNSPPDPQVVSRVYEQALAKQRAGDSAGALQGFQNFLKQYPRHELAPNAQYWLGEVYYRLGDYPNAIAAQQKLMAAYPDHLKVPDAMLILANAQQSAGDATSARKTLEDLVARYPVSEAAEKGKQRLGRIK